jgi:LAO/AO transport system kinase
VNEAGHSRNSAPAIRRRRSLSAAEYVEGVLARDRSILARAITLIESTSASHEAQAQEVLQKLLPYTGKARRIGITGVPGVGKSTFIEAFGTYLIQRGHQLAVLTIDPSSTKSHGSILGDKTRMERLSRDPSAFIRPSPTGENLGGVARKTREALLVCEAAGYDVILIETVGVGQSEVELRSMVDFFLLLLLPGAGDELQGIKKGIVEMADAVLINKADGENRTRAQQALAEHQGALHYLQPPTPGWKTPVALCSGLTGEGVSEAWELVEKFYRRLEPAGVIAKRRQEQSLEWLSSLVRYELWRRFDANAAVRKRLPELQQSVLRGQTTPVQAAKALLELFIPASNPSYKQTDSSC